MMRKLLIALLIFFAGVTSAFALSGNTFDEANQAYTASDYSKASELYFKMISQGSESASLYYNLGNSYYRMNQLGSAYWAFKKAHHLAPHDEDVYQNLKFVEGKLTKVQVEDGRWLLKRWFDEISSKIKATGWLLLAFLFSVLFCRKILIYFGREQGEKKDLISMVALILLMILCLIASFLVKQDTFGIHQGVILNSDTEIRYQPSYDGATAFKLPEGAVVPITRKYSDWYQIRVSESKNGWVHEGEFRSL